MFPTINFNRCKIQLKALQNPNNLLLLIVFINFISTFSVLLTAKIFPQNKLYPTSPIGTTIQRTRYLADRAAILTFMNLPLTIILGSGAGGRGGGAGIPLARWVFKRWKAEELTNLHKWVARMCVLQAAVHFTNYYMYVYSIVGHIITGLS